MIYNNKDLTKKEGRPGRGGDGQEEEGTAKKEREAQRKEGGSCVTERGWPIPVLERGVPSP